MSGSGAASPASSTSTLAKRGGSATSNLSQLKRGAKGAAAAAAAAQAPPEPEPGVVLCQLRVEIEAEVAPFHAASYPDKESTAFDNRFQFTWPNAEALAAPQPSGPNLSPIDGEELPPHSIISPPTGTWDLVHPESDGAPSPNPHLRRWSRSYPMRMDRSALLSWEHRGLDLTVWQRFVAIPAPTPYFRPDGSLMTQEEAEEARAAEAAAAEAATGGRKQRKSSAGGASSTRSADKEAKAKEKEKEKARRKKEQAKAARAGGGGGAAPVDDEEDRPSRAHPELEEQDVPWATVQSTNLLLSPLLFSPFCVSRTISSSPSSSLSPPGGLVHYTLRVSFDSDPMDASVRRELNPLLISMERLENLSCAPCKNWSEMDQVYKPVQCRYDFFRSGLTETIVAPPPVPEPAPVPQGGRQLDSRNGRDSRADSSAASSSFPSPSPSPSPSAPLLTRPVPPPRGSTLPHPHGPSIQLSSARVVYLGLFHREKLVAQIKEKKLRVEVRDREHKDSRSREEVEEEERRKREQAEAARLAEEALHSKNKKGRKKSAVTAPPSSAGSDSTRRTSGRDKKGGSPSTEAIEPQEEEESEEEADPVTEQVSAALSHLSFQPVSVESILASAVSSAALRSSWPSKVEPPPRKQYDALQNVYGVAEFSLDDLFRGALEFELVAPVHPVYPPAHVALIPPQTRLNPYRSSSSSPTPHDETLLTLRFRLSHPLTGSLPHEVSHRFERMVLLFPRQEAVLYQKVLSSLVRINVQVLGLSIPGRRSPTKHKGPPTWGGHVPEEEEEREEESLDISQDISVSLMSLSSIRLTPDQLFDDSELDLLTSVQLLDDHQRLFIVEGLSQAAGGRSMQRLVQRIGRERANQAGVGDFFRFLYNPEVTFPTRLYGGFHAAPKVIRMKAGVTLSSLAKRNSFYVVPRGASADTFAAFQRLYELTRTPNLMVAMRANLFPTLEHLSALEKYFGDFCSDTDLFGTVPSLLAVDRYDPTKRGQVKLLPHPSEDHSSCEPVRPRSRGQARSKAASRSFDQDLNEIRREKKRVERQVDQDQRTQNAMFEALLAETNVQNNLAHQYQYAKTDQLDRTFARAQPLPQLVESSRSSSSSLSSQHTRHTDAEVEEEEDTPRGFRRSMRTQSKSATSTRNEAYLAAKRALQQHGAHSGQGDIVQRNVEAVAAASRALAATKSPSDYPRYLQPHELGLDQFHVYGNQKQNVYALQKKLMREQMLAQEAATAQHKHYTYSPQYLSGSFEKFDPEEEEARRLAEDKAKWQTSDGFRWPPHKTHAESFHHWKDLHPATVEALNRPPEAADTNLASLLDTKAASSSASSLHPDRFRAYHTRSEPFGPPPDAPADWGKSLALGGDAMDELLKQDRQRAKEEWQRKLVVENPHFKVLWTGSGQVGVTNADPDEDFQYALQQFENGNATNMQQGGRTRKQGGVSAPIPAVTAKNDLMAGLLKDPPARPGLRFEKKIRDPETGKVVRQREYPVPNVGVAMHSLAPFIEYNRTIHQRTLEEKEAAEMGGTPRNKRERFTVTAPQQADHFIHRRNIGSKESRPAAGTDSTQAAAATEVSK